MTIYEDNIKELIWSGLLEDFEEDINEEIANHYEDETFIKDECYVKYIKSCIRSVISEDDFTLKMDNEIDNATGWDSDCEEYLCDNGLEDSINNYMDDNLCDNFDLIECTKYNLRDNMDYDYDECIIDIMYGLVEIHSDEGDYDYEKTVDEIVNEQYTKLEEND